MDKISHRTVSVSGIRIHIAEQGSGNLVLLVHGFPSLWYSWRHQIAFLADAGFHAVALDLRGFGQSDVPTEVSKYTQLHHAGDLIGVIEALGEKQAFVVGHDWGSTLASVVALIRPDLVRGLVNLGVPFFPRNPDIDNVSGLRLALGDDVYVSRWQSSENGEAEADFAKHGTKVALAKIYGCRNPAIWKSKPGGTVLDGVELPDPLPAWITTEDLEYYANSFDKTGMSGAFNLYRTMQSSWELLAPWTNQGSNVPALYISGELDMTLTMAPGYPTSAAYKQVLPNLKDAIILPGVAHFAPEEVPNEVNKILVKFLKEN